MKLSEKKLLERTFKRLELIRNSTGVFVDETKEQKQARIKKLLADPKAFVEYYLPLYASAPSADFHSKLAKQVKRDTTCKILVRWGRGLAKSVWCNVVIPLWLWAQKDVNYLVIVGNSFDKAQILLADLRAEFEANQRLINDFGEQQSHGSWVEGYFRTKSGFTAKALGMGQSPRGLRIQHQRPDYIVCDDLEDKEIVRNPMRQDQMVQWIEQDLIPTMDGNRRRYLHPNNNFAPRTIQEELHIKHPKWKLNQVDAYNPVTYAPAWKEKYTADYYKEIEEEIGSLAAKAEYNNKPHIEGKIFTEEQIQDEGERPRLSQFRTIAAHWDIAYAGTKTSDYNAVRVMGLYNPAKNPDTVQFWHIAAFVRQTKMKEAVEWMCEYQLSLPESIKIHWRFEAQFWNDEVKRTIKEGEEKFNTNLHIVKVDTPKGKKYDRILELQPYYQNRRIFYDKNLKADNDTQTAIQQLYGIEPGYRTKDDAPDAEQQVVTYLSKHIRRSESESQIRTGKYKRNNDRRL